MKAQVVEDQPKKLDYQVISYEGFEKVQTTESILEIPMVNLKNAQKQFDKEEHRHGFIKVLN
jgi:hypothetical protein